MKKSSNEESYFFIVNWLWDLQKGLLEADNEIKSMLGYPETTQFEDCHFFSKIKRSQLSYVKNALRQVATDGQSQKIKFILYIHQRCYLGQLCIFQHQLEEHTLSGTFELLMELPDSQQEIELMGELFNSVKDGILISDNEHRIVMANKVFCNETGYEEVDILGENTTLFSNEVEGQEFYEKMWSIADEQGDWHGEIIAKNSSGEAIPRMVHFYKTLINSANKIYYIAISNRMDLAVNDTDTISDSTKQPLLLDFKMFNVSLSEYHASLLAHQTLVGITLDINFTVKLPEKTQHWIISQLLIPFVNDVQFTQIKGNLFAGCFISEKNVTSVNEKLETIIEALNKKEHDITKNIGISTNIGCSILGVDAKNERQLVSHSSQALLSARTPGQDCIIYHDKRILQAVENRKKLVISVEHALKNNLIQVFYQPLLDVKTFKVVQVQALLRIGTEKERDQKTRDKVLIAEENGWIDQFDNLVAQRALSDLPELKKYYNNEQLKLSFNRSMINTHTVDSPLDKTFEIINQSKHKNNLITIDLNAEQLLDDENTLVEQITKLKKSGIKITANNFKNGNTPLEFLKLGVIDSIKISIFNEMLLEPNSHDFLMLKTIVAAVHRFDVKVIVEGVEDTDTLALLVQIGVDYMKGFLFAKPQQLEVIKKQKLIYYHLKYEQFIYQETGLLANQIMNTSSTTIGMDDKLTVAKKLFETTLSDYLVVVESNICKGVLYKSDFHAATSSYIGTEAEQIRDLNTLNRRAHQIMQKNFTSINTNDTLKKVEAVLRLTSKHILVVIGQKGVFLGVITPLEVMDGLARTIEMQKR